MITGGAGLIVRESGSGVRAGVGPDGGEGEAGHEVVPGSAVHGGLAGGGFRVDQPQVGTGRGVFTAPALTREASCHLN